jgi:hypothetical protein
MPKYDYNSWSEVPEKVEAFFFNIWSEEGACLHELNNTLNDLDSWYASQQMDLKDFIDG